MYMSVFQREWTGCGREDKPCGRGEEGGGAQENRREHNGMLLE